MSTSVPARVRTVVRRPFAVAAVACAGIAVSLLSASVGGAEARTASDCVVTANALGAATGWTEFVETNGVRGAESEGAIAYGGNHSAGGMTVGTRLPSGFAAGSPALVVGGSHGTYNLQKGSAYLTPATGVNFNGGSGTGYLGSNPVDFATAFTQLRGLSAAWGAASANGAVTTGTAGGNAALILTGTDTALNVFTLTTGQAADLTAGKHLALDVPSGATTIINVPGTTPSIAGQAWRGSGPGASQLNDTIVMSSFAGLVWNFPSATAVTIGYGSAFPGTILAPNAALTIASAGHTIGQVIAKSFSSNFETHQSLFPTSACVPGPPPTPAFSDVTISKSASAGTTHGGDTLTYTLTASNVGSSPATGVVLSDQLPNGVTFVSASSPCIRTAGLVTCDVGTLAVGASTSVTVTVLANPIAGAGPVAHPQAHHGLTPYKAETQVDLEPGEQRSVTLACASGDILSDGQLRVDHVDQGTGSTSDVRVLSSQATALGTWKGVIRNDAAGRAQAKAFVVCLPAQTEPADRQTGYADSHQHPISADPGLASVTRAFTAGRASASLTCPAGTVPVAPGFALSSAGARLVGSETDQAHPRVWTFTLDAPAPVTATFTARCLRTTVGPVYGHTHELRFTHVARTVTVPGHTAAEGDEFAVICPDDAKGVVATWTVPPGVQHVGNDPRLKERAFRLFNDTGAATSATLDLVCLHDRTSTEQMGTTDPVVVPNTATVSSVSADANSANNAATATITVQPGSSTTGVGALRVTGSAPTLRVVSSMPGRGTLTVRSGGTLLAQGAVALRAGGATTARLRLTTAGAHRLAHLDRVRVRVDPTRGSAVTRTVRVG
jgi:choice-of-anchor A domain-containing protein/uncharacterized repeat protein (TIGR01451 family)